MGLIMNFDKAKVAIIGLGYVGLPLAIEFGKSRPTLGFDISEKRVKELKKSNDLTQEVCSEDFKKASFIEFSNKEADLEKCSIFIVTVPTPIDDVNRPDLTPLSKASETVAKYLKNGNIVIYESTVYPGCTEEICVPILESISNLKYNEDFFCGYSPERINPGDKINTLTKIKKITSGSNAETSKIVDDLYKSIIEAGTFKATSIKVAEAAKVIENTQRDLNIALTNELSVIFQRLNIDTLEVLEAAGSKWNFLPFRPGIVGGHCIGVDPYYLTYKAEQVKYNPQVILAGRRINDNMGRYAAKTTIQRMLQNNINVAKSEIGILGITFKENCPDVRNSKVIDIYQELEKWNVNISVYDPWADPDEVQKQYGITLSDLNNFKKLDSIIVAVGHTEFRNYSPEQLKKLCKGDNPVIADIKSLYDRNNLSKLGFDVFRF